MELLVMLTTTFAFPTNFSFEKTAPRISYFLENVDNSSALNQLNVDLAIFSSPHYFRGPKSTNSPLLRIIICPNYDVFLFFQNKKTSKSPNYNYKFIVHLIFCLLVNQPRKTAPSKGFGPLLWCTCIGLPPRRYSRWLKT